MIQVSDKYYINADSRCYSLQEKSTIQDPTSDNYGKEFYKDIGYYQTIKQCLDGIITKELRQFISNENINTLKELQNKINELHEFIQSLNLE